MISTRRRSRGLVLQALYEIDSSGHPAEHVIEYLAGVTSLSPDNRAFFENMVRGVSTRKKVLDEYIVRFAPAWPISQLSIVDRNILRISIFELLYSPDIPVKVSINEAVELAKSFGSDNSPRFVNGVLSSVVTEMEKQGPLPLQ